MIEALAAKIRDIKDFPKKGIVFKDITPLLGDPQTFNTVSYTHLTLPTIYSV